MNSETTTVILSLCVTTMTKFIKKLSVTFDTSKINTSKIFELEIYDRNKLNLSYIFNSMEGRPWLGFQEFRKTILNGYEFIYNPTTNHRYKIYIILTDRGKILEEKNITWISQYFINHTIILPIFKIDCLIQLNTPTCATNLDIIINSMHTSMIIYIYDEMQKFISEHKVTSSIDPLFISRHSQEKMTAMKNDDKYSQLIDYYNYTIRDFNYQFGPDKFGPDKRNIQFIYDKYTQSITEKITPYIILGKTKKYSISIDDKDIINLLSSICDTIMANKHNRDHIVSEYNKEHKFHHTKMGNENTPRTRSGNDDVLIHNISPPQSRERSPSRDRLPPRVHLSPSDQPLVTHAATRHPPPPPRPAAAPPPPPRHDKDYLKDYLIETKITELSPPETSNHLHTTQNTQQQTESYKYELIKKITELIGILQTEERIELQKLISIFSSIPATHDNNTLFESIAKKLVEKNKFHRIYIILHDIRNKRVRDIKDNGNLLSEFDKSLSVLFSIYDAIDINNTENINIHDKYFFEVNKILDILITTMVIKQPDIQPIINEIKISEKLRDKIIMLDKLYDTLVTYQSTSNSHDTYTHAHPRPAADAAAPAAPAAAAPATATATATATAAHARSPAPATATAARARSPAARGRPAPAPATATAPAPAAALAAIEELLPNDTKYKPPKYTKYIDLFKRFGYNNKFYDLSNMLSAPDPINHTYTEIKTLTMPDNYVLTTLKFPSLPILLKIYNKYYITENLNKSMTEFNNLTKYDQDMYENKIKEYIRAIKAALTSTTGGYRDKYLKYKYKYLQLKNKLI